MQEPSNIQQNQQGMVSIVVTLVMMIVISLIVIGFGQIARREQRQALDHQLTTQAYYAAESGVNAAIKAINAGYTGKKATCGGSDLDTQLGALHNVIDAAKGIEYSCLLIDQYPTSLEYGSINTNKSTLIPINSVNSSGVATNLSQLDIYWQATDGSTTFDTLTAIGIWPTVAAWGTRTGVIRASLTYLPSTGYNRDDLIDNTFTIFAYPANLINNPTTNGAIPYVPYPTGTVNRTGQGRFPNGNCTTTIATDGRPKYCSAHICFGPAATIGWDKTTQPTIPRCTGTVPFGSKFLLRLGSIYKSSNVTIKGLFYDGVSTYTAANFQGGQATIDSTGKAGDILRRIQVRTAKVTNEYNYPEYVFETTDAFCKRLMVTPTDTTRDNAYSSCRIPDAANK